MTARYVCAALMMAPLCLAGDAYFEVSVPPDRKTLVVRVSDPATIAKARDILAGRETDAIRLMGKVARAPEFYNPSWPFHVDPSSVSFFSMATEVCDTSLSELAAHLDEVGGALLPGNVMCPWSSVLVKELPEPAEAAKHITSVLATDYSGVALAPGSIASAFGTNLSDGGESAGAELPVSLRGVSVRVKDSAGEERASQIYFVSASQVNYVVPEKTAPGLATVTLMTTAGAQVTGQVFIQAITPSLFTVDGTRASSPAGWVFRVRADGTTSYESIADGKTGKPVAIDLGAESDQVYLCLLGTGLRGRPSLESVALTMIGAEPAPAVYAGEQSSPGVDQLNVLLPHSLTGAGEITAHVSVTLEDRTLTSQHVQLKFK